MSDRPIAPAIDSPRALAGRRVVVMGLGLHGGGLGVAQFLRRHGASLVVTDLRDASQLAPSLERLGAHGVRYVLGRHDLQDFRDAEIVVRNPAVPLDAPALTVARAAGARIEMELTMFLRWCAPRGSWASPHPRQDHHGAALHAMVRAGGHPTRLAGNMGVSALTQLDEIQPDEVVVLEMSSWQTEAWRGPACAVRRHRHHLLPDHLNRYDSMEALRRRQGRAAARAAGGRLGGPARRSGLGRLVRVSGQQPRRPRAGGRPSARVGRRRVTRGAQSFEPGGCRAGRPTARCVRGGGAARPWQASPAWRSARSFSEPSATSASSTTPRPPFPMPPWRPSTPFPVPGCSSPAVRTSGLISARWPSACGATASCGAWVMLPGAGTDRLCAQLGSLAPVAVDSMEAAVAAALDMAQPGDAVLLSPACASFGLFAHEFDRGAQFIAAAEARGLVPPTRGGP